MGLHPLNISSLERKDSPRGTAPRLRGDGTLRAFLPVLPGSRESAAEGPMPGERRDPTVLPARRCRRAAPQTPQAPWFAEAGGPACNRVRTSMLWIHSPTPFSWGGGTLQCRCKLMCSRETERLVFLLRPLTGQVLSTKFPAASLQGQGRLRWESQSVPLREGEVGTQAESPASTPALQRVSNPPV